MPSADFCRPFPSPLDNGSTRQIGQISPGNAHPPSRLCPPHLRPCLPDRYGTLKIVAFSSGMTALYAISVRRTSALPAASFRFHLAMDTLAVRLTAPPVGPVEDFHLQVGAPCRAHHQKSRAMKALPEESLSELKPVYAFKPHFRRSRPSPASPEPRSQRAPGMGTIVASRGVLPYP